jgi:arylsulfatase A
MRCLFACLLSLGSTLFSAQPNVILIMADDFGYECVTANGGESYQTPHLDRLAASGMRFEHCHSQPLCTPTRVQLMTGKYNVRNYLKFGTLMRTETTFGHLLKKAGYATGICGKWQLGHEKDAPQHFGFDEALLWQHTRRPPRYANPGLELNGKEKEYPEGSYGPDLVNDFALDFVTRHQEKPFFLYYPMILTHDPYQPTPDSPDWDPKIRSEAKQRDGKHFAEMVTYMDKLIGRLDAKLDELGIRDNTLLLFTGDNGTGKSATSRFKGADFPGGKGSTTHSGHHVPLIVSWPAVIKQGQVNRDLITCTDFLATFCAVAGTPAPDGIDGVSFLPQLQGKPGTPREAIYMWYSPRQSKDLAVKELAFDHHHKLYRTGELYDLQSDPHEKTPLNGQHPSRVKLQAVLDQYKDTRSAKLDRQFEQSGVGQSKKDKKKNNVAN